MRWPRTGTTVARVSTSEMAPIEAAPEDLERVRYGADGLVVAVVQEAVTAEVLMVAYMNEEALSRTLATGRSWFYSRSRQQLWCKGETSGDRQWVRSVSYDCDGDALLVRVDQEGRGACHTGERTCFYRHFGRQDGQQDGGRPGTAPA